MAQYGMPMAPFFLVGAIVLELVEAFASSLAGLLDSGSLAGYLSDPDHADLPCKLCRTHADDHVHENVSMLGGCLFLLAAGPGKFSLDHLFRVRKTNHASDPLEGVVEGFFATTTPQPASCPASWVE